MSPHGPKKSIYWASNTVCLATSICMLLNGFICLCVWCYTTSWDILLRVRKMKCLSCSRILPASQTSFSFHLKITIKFYYNNNIIFKVQLKRSLTDLPTRRKRKSRDFENKWTEKVEIRIIGLLHLLIMWSTFGEHKNSSLLKNFASTSWKSALKLGNLYIFNRISQK